MHGITLTIITYQRQTLLRQTLAELIQLDIPQNTTVEIVVVDNDVAGSAREVITSLAEKSPIPIRYYIEPIKGRGFARNRVLDETCTSDYIAFIDDDIKVQKTWLTQMYAFMQSSGAQLVVSNIDYELPKDAPEWAHYCRLFSIDFPPTATRLRFAKTGNLLADARWIRKHNIRFPNQLSHEDMAFSHDAFTQGALILSCAEVMVTTKVEPERIYLSWVWRRCMHNGMARAHMIRQRSTMTKATFTCCRNALELAYFATGAFTLYLCGKHHWIRSFEHLAMSTGWILGLFIDTPAIILRATKYEKADTDRQLYYK